MTKPILFKKLEALDIPFHKDTPTRFRHGGTNGERLSDKLLCGELLERNITPQKKLELYRSIVTNAIRLRKFQLNRRDRYDSHGFTAALSESLGINIKVLQRLIKGMRTELCLSLVNSPQKGDEFWKCVRSYIEAYSHPPSLTPYNINELTAQFNKRDIKGFYQELYRVNERKSSKQNNEVSTQDEEWNTESDEDGKQNSRQIGAFLSYEIGALFAYYKPHYSESGSDSNKQPDNRPLSDFDKLLLDSKIRNVPQVEQFKKILELTGIRINKSILSTHRNMIVYGEPYDDEINTEVEG